MTISVLMSVYKCESVENFDTALRSIWTDQTKKPDQVVLIEDGPLGDGLLAVVDKWAGILGDELVVHRNETNIGLTKSLNIGIGYVTSDVIARMDSDDISDPMRFERQTRFLEENPDVAIVGGSMQEFSQKTENLGIRHYPADNDEVLRSIYKASPLAHPTVMMRACIFRNGLRYNERFPTSQDIALWFDALALGYKIGNVSEVTLYFRRDDQMFRRRSRAKAWNEFQIYISGVRRLYGLFTYKYFYPVSRFFFRLMPVVIVRLIYGSKIRYYVVDKGRAGK